MSRFMDGAKDMPPVDLPLEDPPQTDDSGSDAQTQ
jgi:hypothetical protein